MCSSVKTPMYVLRPVCNLPDKLDLPTNMYRLPKIGEIIKKGPPEVLRNIQDKVNKILKENNLSITELEERWDRVLADLHDLAKQMAAIRKSVDEKSPANEVLVLNGVAITANPKNPPYSLFLIRELYKNDVNFNIMCHTHSSVTGEIPKINGRNAAVGSVPTVDVILIWKEGALDTQLVLNPFKMQPILGEINILRLLARLGLGLGYNESSELTIDLILDQCYRLAHSLKDKPAILRDLSEKLGKKRFFGGEKLNIADIAVWSVLKQSQSKDLGPNLKAFYLSVDRLLQ